MIPYPLLDVIPGADFIGFGFDARYEDPRNALTVPIMSWGFGQKKSYIYPPDPDHHYKVPDQMMVRTIATTVTNAYMCTTTTEYTNTLAINFGFNYGQVNSQNQTSQTCVTTKSSNTSTACSTNDYTAQGKAFGIGARVNYQSAQLSTQENVLVVNEERTALYHAYLDTRYIAGAVKEDMNTLATIHFPTNPQPFFDFLTKYGTHYVNDAQLGGVIKSYSNIQTSINQQSTTVGVEANVIYVNAGQAMKAGSGNFYTGVNVEAGLEYDTSDTVYKQAVAGSWALNGGDANAVNLLDMVNTTVEIRNWKPTIVNNPIPVAFRLREVSTLFDDQTISKYMHDAIALYLATQDTQDIVGISYQMRSNAPSDQIPSSAVFLS